MNDSEFYLLVTKKFSGAANDIEINALEDALKNNTRFSRQYKLLERYWNEHPNTNHDLVENALRDVLRRLDLQAEVPENLSLKANNKKPLYRFVSITAVAASIAALILLSVFFQERYSGKKTTADISKIERKQNSKGIKSIIELSDGSKVWLNADSKMQYPQSFSGNTREVYLDGEAFFNVAKNPQKPFIIHLANGTVKVVGTSFNVRAYNNERVVETAVATGKVAFIPKYKTDNKKQDTVFITPNNKVRYLVMAEKISVVPTLISQDMGWTEGKLIFNSMRLEDIATELERNFGKKIVFVDAEAKDFIFTGSFQNNSLAEIMYYLSLSKPKKIYYKITNNELLIATNAEKL